MEITVRRGPDAANGAPSKFYSGAVTFLEAGPRALTRIPLSAQADSYGGTIRALMEGFNVTATVHDEHSVEFRVLTALCIAEGVVELDF